MRRTKLHKNWKVILFWLLGAMCITFATMITGNLEMGPGVTESSFLFALGIAFLLFLIGGLFWISVSVAIEELEEK